MNQEKSPLIIANISGFYGDRQSAPQEMLEGGHVDFLTGDYLAELTMAILYKSKIKSPDLGYAKTFLRQMEGIMGQCLDKGVKVVVNAGGLNPSGLAKGLEHVAGELKIRPNIAYVEGDDLMPRLTDLRKSGVELRHLDKNISLGESGLLPVSANAYLGCWGIVEALNRGADIVVTGRVADTSVVMGPAAYHFAWAKDNWDALAGAATAGHIIECSGQASGGNYSYFEEVKSYKRLGFPIAEINSDGSSIITKHNNTGGLVSVGTVTSQLMYEINAPEYITPDVVAHFDTLEIAEESEDRVSISGIKGSPATDSSKVTVNCMDGFQNSMTFQIVGLDTDKKVDILKKTIRDQFSEDQFDELQFEYSQSDQKNAVTNEQAMSLLRIYIKDSDAQNAGRAFTSKLVEIALCMVPGVCWAHPPGPAKPRIIHFPALIDKKHIKQKVFINGDEISVDEISYDDAPKNIMKPNPPEKASFEGETKLEQLGRICAARSGDKGGNANMGVWAKTERAYQFLDCFLSIDKIKELLPDMAEFEIIKYDFPNLLGMNFYIIGLLQDGVAASTRIDPQAKTLGEYLRSRWVDIPVSLLD